MRGGEDPLATINGTSMIGAWPLLPYLGLNPFMLQDNYKDVYDRIIPEKDDTNLAWQFIETTATKRTYSETIKTKAPALHTQIREPGMFNKNMWEAFSRGYFAKKSGDLKTAEKYFLQARFWAEQVVSNDEWMILAKRDNDQKKKEFGGLISYPWGVTYKHNDSPLHDAIWRYPLLNEMGAAMWGLVTAYFELGDYIQAKYWISRIIDDVSLHQIPDVVQGQHEAKLIKGYWNALVTWEDVSSGYERDAKVGLLYSGLLKERGIFSAKPGTVVFSP